MAFVQCMDTQKIGVAEVVSVRLAEAVDPLYVHTPTPRSYLFKLAKSNFIVDIVIDFQM